MEDIEKLCEDLRKASYKYGSCIYMSRNTVLYHVDKMKRMTGHDPRTFEGLAACLKMMEEE